VTDDKLDLGEFAYKVSDFYDPGLNAVLNMRNESLAKKVVDCANELLAARLKAHGVRVYGHLWPDQKPGCETAWGSDLAPADTHTALLILPRKLGET
jgi:hypothetical protein